MIQLYPIQWSSQATVSIQRAVENLNWQYAFERKTINEEVQVFNEVLMNIISNFVP